MTAGDFLAAFEPPAPRAAPDGGEPGIEACDRQADTTTVTHTFLGDVPEAERARIRRWVDETRAVYARRWCVEAGFENYAGEGSALSAKYLEVRGFAPSSNFCGDYLAGVVFVAVRCVSERTYPHEYFHVLQDAVRGGVGQYVPRWLIEGTASYAEVMQRGAVSGSSSEALERYLSSRLEILGRIAMPSLAALEGSLATQWGTLVYDLGVRRHPQARQPIGGSGHRGCLEASGGSVGDMAGRVRGRVRHDDRRLLHGVRGVPCRELRLHHETGRDVLGAGRRTQPDGNPLVRAWVGADDGGGGDWEDTTHTGTDGAFVLALPDGDYQPLIQLRGMGCPHSTSFMVSGADVSGVVIQLSAPCT